MVFRLLLRSSSGLQYSLRLASTLWLGGGMARVRLAFKVLSALIPVFLASSCSGSGEREKDDRGGSVVRFSGEVGLMSVMEQAADAGKGFSLRDATNLDRYIYPGNPKGYFACFKRDSPEVQAVDFYAVPVAEGCPVRLGAQVPVPEIPELRGVAVGESYVAAMMAGYEPKFLKVFKIGTLAVEVDPKSVAQWRVCMQNPLPGGKFDAKREMWLQVSESCS